MTRFERYGRDRDNEAAVLNLSGFRTIEDRTAGRGLIAIGNATVGRVVFDHLLSHLPRVASQALHADRRDTAAQEHRQHLRLERPERRVEAIERDLARIEYEVVRQRLEVNMNISGHKERLRLSLGCKLRPAGRRACVYAAPHVRSSLRAAACEGPQRPCGEGGGMRGNDKVIAELNEALREELTAINQYFIHGEMCHNWGYHRLGSYIRKQAIDEMKHAEGLIERILFLDGTPKMEYLDLNVGENVRQQIEADLKLEINAVAMYNKAIKVARDQGDDQSRDLFSQLLKDEEAHVDWLEAQVHLIKEMGYERYLSMQMEGKNE